MWRRVRDKERENTRIDRDRRDTYTQRRKVSYKEREEIQQQVEVEEINIPRDEEKGENEREIEKGRGGREMQLQDLYVSHFGFLSIHAFKSSDIVSKVFYKSLQMQFQKSYNFN